LRELKEWLAEVWEEIQQNRPAWFTDESVRVIPHDLIPNIDHSSVREEIGGVNLEIASPQARGRRKSSVQIIGSAIMI